MSKKVLVILAHPNIKNSVANKKWKEEIEKDPNVIVHDIYSTYPDGKIDVAKELKLLAETGTLILQFPIQWFNCPSLLKAWIDDVYMAAHYGEGEKVLAGKKIGLAVTTGGLKDVYDGSKGLTISEVLTPFRFSIGHLGAVELPIYSIYGVNSLSEVEIAENAKGYAEYIKRNM